jgi:hypothetical protein
MGWANNPGNPNRNRDGRWAALIFMILVALGSIAPVYQALRDHPHFPDAPASQMSPQGGHMSHNTIRGATSTATFVAP